MKLFPNSDLSTILSTSHPIFLFVEKQFWTWLENSNPAMEYKEMYFSEDAIYTKHGAIQEAIESALDEAIEESKPVDLASFDYDAIFSG
jgi:hypothetical protein